MKGAVMRGIVVSVGLLLPAFMAHADPLPAQPQAGQTYEVTSDREWSKKGSDGMTASSTDRDALLERVIGVTDAGVELEYDLPKDTSAEDRARSWQFPARILKPAHGPLRLLNEAELTERVDRWLKGGGLTRAACGHWVFTWNAFQIECDPQSVLRAIEHIDLTPGDLRDGALYKAPGALAAAPLMAKKADSRGSTFVVEMAIDPEAVRRDRARSDMVIAEITRKPLTLEVATRTHATEDISGTIAVTFETDPAGRVRRRTTVTKIDTKAPNGKVAEEVTTETVEERALTATAPPPASA